MSHCQGSHAKRAQSGVQLNLRPIRSSAKLFRSCELPYKAEVYAKLGARQPGVISKKRIKQATRLYKNLGLREVEERPLVPDALPWPGARRGYRPVSMAVSPKQCGFGRGQQRLG
ncbi:MAG: hypothetical protein KatS3mg109_2348 [Pirellulaceae bacterium]|nr:MAG: hypothetical protein KatS3mg109_2348 [Pirellulaceae bacterium]